MSQYRSEAPPTPGDAHRVIAAHPVSATDGAVRALRLLVGPDTILKWHRDLVARSLYCS